MSGLAAESVEKRVFGRGQSGIGAHCPPPESPAATRVQLSRFRARKSAPEKLPAV
jgi:hypothetical protein